MAEILVVDDERAIREGLKMTLSSEGFSVRTARDGDDALRKIGEHKPDLVLLDVMMPRMNGFAACESIRKEDKLLPVIFLTAKDSEADQVRGIGLGADDYISKDCGDAMMLARINRALARSSAIGESVRSASGETIALGAVSVDLKTFAVTEKGKEIARLTKTEADILKLLDSQRGKLVVQDDIITDLRGNGFACEDTMLYVHICNLRRKLGSASSKIVNKRGVGYCLDA